MNVFIIGITSGIGDLLAQKLRSRGDAVHGLVRRRDQQAGLETRGINARVGDLSSITVEALAATFGDVDTVVFSAGSNGGSKEVTKAIDGDGVGKAIRAARLAGVERFALVSVLPESWRERELGKEVEYYFAVTAGLAVDGTSDNSPREGLEGRSVAFFTDAGHRGLAQHLRDGRFFWLDLEAPADVAIEELGVRFGLHPLTVEDALTFDQRPKIEEYRTYAFMVLHGADPSVPAGEPLLHEVHLIISEQFVITLHRRPSATLAALRARYGARTIRSEQFLIYKILQAVVDTFLPVLTTVAADIDEIEAAVIADPREDSLEQIFALKRHLISIREVVAPLRDVFAHNAERIGELPGLEGDGRLYFRDVYDSLIRVSNLVDSYRDLTTGATDLYMQKVGNR